MTARRKIKDKLTPYRRHATKCPIQEAAIVTKCDCPLWCHGRLKGKRVRFSLETRSLAQADLKIKDKLNGDDDTPPEGGSGPKLVGQKIDAKNVEIATAVERFFDSRKSFAPGTRKVYDFLLKRLLKFADAHSITLLREITDEHVLAFLEVSGKKWGKRTQFARLKSLKVFLNFCVTKKWLASSPAGKDLLPAPSKTVPVQAMRQPFTHQEIARILAAVETFKDPAERIRARALINLLLFSGMRISDAVFCERSYLAKDHTLHYIVIKTGRPIEVAPWLNERATDALAKLPKSRVYFFLPDRDDDYWDARHALMTGEARFADMFPGGYEAYKRVKRRMELLVMRVLRKAGIRESERIETAKRLSGERKRLCSEGSCHRFRDTFAVNLLIGGTDIFAVSRMLGHKDVKITAEHYLKLMDGYQKQLSRATQSLNYPLAG
jgi:site-specific recombinase XerD